MLTIHAEKRQKTGTSISRKLRVNNQFPGILYGIHNAIILLTLDHNTILNLQNNIEFYKKNLFLCVGNNNTYKVKVQAIQRHVFKLKLLHIDFLYIK